MRAPMNTTAALITLALVGSSCWSDPVGRGIGVQPPGWVIDEGEEPHPEQPLRVRNSTGEVVVCEIVLVDGDREGWELLQPGESWLAVDDPCRDAPLNWQAIWEGSCWLTDQCNNGGGCPSDEIIPWRAWTWLIACE